MNYCVGLKLLPIIPWPYFFAKYSLPPSLLPPYSYNQVHHSFVPSLVSSLLPLTARVLLTFMWFFPGLSLPPSPVFNLFFSSLSLTIFHPLSLVAPQTNQVGAWYVEPASAVESPLGRWGARAPSGGTRSTLRDIMDIVPSNIMEGGSFSAAAGFDFDPAKFGVFSTFSVSLEMVTSEVMMARPRLFSTSSRTWMAENTCHFGLDSFFADNGFSDTHSFHYFPADALHCQTVAVV
ncbi:hypothetical protein B0H19DRAFT_1253167 [Mycena capillaripes]|nr:hypothetical protein B0H19DRAFT_1253167 [Mycena capillaripes]